MLDVLSRASVASLTAAAAAVAPVRALGFAHRCPDGRISIFYSHPFGVGSYLVEDADLLAALIPDGTEPRQASEATIRSAPERAIEWQLLVCEVRQIVSLRVPGTDALMRVWFGLGDGRDLGAADIAAFERIATDVPGLLENDQAQGDPFERLSRLELAAGLLPAILRVLDVREVFDRLSSISQAALQHDMLTLGVLSDDLTMLTMYARTGAGPNLGSVFPQPYPPSVSMAWDFDIIDDRKAFPPEQDRPPTRLGMRSSVRVPFRFEGTTIGGLAFHAHEPAKYSSIDIAVARRLAEYVAVAMSHHRLAERAAEQARQSEELRARTTNLELLDEMLAQLVDTGSLREVFGRLSAIASKVLPHDALGLPVMLPDGRHAKRYAAHGLEIVEAPEVLDIPSGLTDTAWEHELFDDVTQVPGVHNENAIKMGFRSVLRVPIRLDGRLAAFLAFLSRAPATFKPEHILVARRIADRVAVTLSREREAEAARRADEAHVSVSKLEARVRALTDELDARTGYRRVVGESLQWRQVLTQATQVAATDTTVLLLGESGTGKEVVARFLHRGSMRKGGPFIALNCAALPEQLLEAELFGYERGAFTGAVQSKPGQLEQAAGGTLFLDEVGEMSPTAQAKFLRVLQEREFQRLGGTRVLRADARIVAATNRDLPRAIANGQFREDLYYRLNVFAIRLPPLRDRRDDVLTLSEAFLVEIGRGLGRPAAGISRDARQLLVGYHWPGNVRELRNILERASILCDGGLITADHLALPMPSPASPAVVPLAVETPLAVAPAPAVPTVPAAAADLQRMERAMIEQALQSARFNKSKAAKTLGLTRHQLYIRMRKHGFE